MVFFFQQLIIRMLFQHLFFPSAEGVPPGAASSGVPPSGAFPPPGGAGNFGSGSDSFGKSLRF
jgi:hypothetical protein